MIRKILVANRGEIAIRVMRSCYEMGIRSVAVYSSADRLSRHVLFANEAECIGGAASSDSYLNIDHILEAAHKHKVDAIHPVNRRASYLSVPVQRRWKRWATRLVPVAR